LKIKHTITTKARAQQWRKITGGAAKEEFAVGIN